MPPAKPRIRKAQSPWIEWAFRAGKTLWHAAININDHEGFELSGHVAFTALFSLFPFVLFLAALAGFIGDSGSISTLIALASRFVPASVTGTLIPIINDVLAKRHADLLTLGIVFALWSASSGIEALRILLNRSYAVPETRPVWHRRLDSILIVMVGALLVIAVSSLTLFGTFIWNFVAPYFPNNFITQGAWGVLRYCIAGIILAGSVIGLHFVLPNCKLSLARIWPGAIITTMLLGVGSSLFSIYINDFSSYNVVYGSLSGIIITLIYFYAASLILVFGAEINFAWLEQLPRTRQPAKGRKGAKVIAIAGE